MDNWVSNPNGKPKTCLFFKKAVLKLLVLNPNGENSKPKPFAQLQAERGVFKSQRECLLLITKKKFTWFFSFQIPMGKFKASASTTGAKVVWVSNPNGKIQSNRDHLFLKFRFRVSNPNGKLQNTKSRMRTSTHITNFKSQW